MRARHRLTGAVLAVLLLTAAPSTAPCQEGGGGPEDAGGAPPGVVLTASAAYPGLGQLLNGKESKALMIGAVEAFLVARLVLEDRWTRNAFRMYRQTGEARYFDQYSDHFDRRQTLVWWVVVAGLYGMIDAYVDAHLSGFDRPVSPHFEAVGLGGGNDRGLRLGLAIRF